MRLSPSRANITEPCCESALKGNHPETWKRRLGGLLTLLLVLVTVISVRANNAGGYTTVVTTPVTTGSVTYNGSACEYVDNGIIHAVIQITSSNVVSLKYLAPGSPGTPLANGVEMVSQFGATGPSNTNFGTHVLFYSASGGATFGNSCVFSFATPPTSAQADLAFTHTYNASADASPWDTVVHWVLRQGNTGLYTYLETNHPASYGAASFGQTTLAWGMAHDATNFTLENVYIDQLGDGQLDNLGEADTRRNGLNTSFLDGENTSITNPGTGQPNAKEIDTVDNSDGNEPSSPFLGFVDSKYAYNADYAQLGCWGRASDLNHLGGWFVLGSPESLNDGPTVQDYVQGWGLLYLDLTSGHDNNDPSFNVPAGANYSKVWGPYFIYMNSFSTGAENWADAKKQVTAEQAAWPYSWLNYLPAYQTSSQRATVSGKIVITDDLNTSASGNGAWVGLAAPDDGAVTTYVHGVAPEFENNWQFQGSGYQYWVQAASDGSFTLKNVATKDCYGNPMTYSLYVYSNGVNGANGVIGEYQALQVTPTAGQTSALGTVNWWVPHSGLNTVFQIGNPDRQSQEFAYSKTAYQPLNFWSYANGGYERFFNSHDFSGSSGAIFPNPLNYDTSTNNPALLNYVNFSYNGVEWKWNLNFNLSSAPSPGNYWLTIAYAGNDVTTRPDNQTLDQGNQRVYVNGTQLSFPINGGYMAQGFYAPNPDVGFDLLLRENLHGKYGVSHVAIPSSMLTTGANTITLSADTIAGRSVLMYDAIRFETPNPLDDGVYTMSTQPSGSNLYTAGLTAPTDTNVKVYTYPGGGNTLDQWQVQNLGLQDGGRILVKFYNVATGLVLTGTSSHTVIQAPDNGSSSQVWQEHPNGATYNFRCTGQSYMGLDGQTVAQPYTSGSNALILSNVNYNAPGQNWTLTPTNTANTIDVNFSGSADPLAGAGAYTGDGVTSPYWNNVTANTTNLVTSNGQVTTGVGISFADSGTYSAPTTPALLGQFLLALSSSTQTATLTGLTPNGHYQLYLYGQNGSYNNRGATFSITTGSGLPAAGSNASTINAANGNAFVENKNYVVFNAVATSAGTLGISWTQPPAGGGEGDFNGLQIVPTN